VKKRGLPEGYVRGLEKLWGIAIKEVDTIEDSILTALAGNNDNESVLNVWNDESKPPRILIISDLSLHLSGSPKLLNLNARTVHGHAKLMRSQTTQKHGWMFGGSHKCLESLRGYFRLKNLQPRP